MKKFLLALYFFPAIVICQGKVDFTGNLNYYYISRLSDGSLINLPFRIANFNIQKEHDIFSIYSSLSMEYRIPNDNHFLDNTSPQDFIWDLRELYLTWQLKNAEIRIGKQIYSWGSTDGNSPIDNLNANDYYYLFESGSEQKIGAFSTAIDYFLNSWKLGFSISPVHQTSRLPINDPEFPIGLHASPKASQVIEVNKPIEFGGYLTKSLSKGDITLSYFDGYDRVFSPSGFNVWDNEFSNAPGGPVIDTVFAYRKTEVIGVGTVIFLGNLTLRGDFAYFITKDPNINFFGLEYVGTALSEIEKESNIYTDIREADSRSFKVNAEYYQTNIQFEYELPWDLQIAGQYIQYDTLRYVDDFGTIDIDLPDLEINFTAADYFFPGLGTNIAILTKRVLLMDFTKTLYDNQIELSLRTMMDQIHSGKLIEMGLGYEINENLKSYLAVNKIIGDVSQDEMYTFNHMEDFSHIRLELKYYY